MPPQPARATRAVVASNGPTWKLCIASSGVVKRPDDNTAAKSGSTPRHEYHQPGLASSQGSDQPNFTGVRLQRQADWPCRLRGEADPERPPWASSSGGTPLGSASSPIVSVSAPRQRCAAPTVLQRRPSGHHANPLLSPPRRYSCRIRPGDPKTRELKQAPRDCGHVASLRVGRAPRLQTSCKRVGLRCKHPANPRPPKPRETGRNDHADPANLRGVWSPFASLRRQLATSGEQGLNLRPPGPRPEGLVATGAQPR